jgi:hypothetical protein
MSTNTSTVVPWTGIWVTSLVGLAQGVIFYCFFLRKRAKDKASYAAVKNEESSSDSESPTRAVDLYEPRQHTRRHRSPPAYGTSWWKEAYALDDEETLRCVGLDSFMFLRLLRLGSRICALGTAFSFILIPIYATGNARGIDTEQFNLLTLARVEQGSSWRLYVTVIVWWFFVAAVLIELWKEWVLYYRNRTEFLARGDIDMPREYRYAVCVEQVGNNSDQALKRYFERLFPGKVQQTASCLQTSALEELIKERQKIILKLEAATAAMHAKPDKPRAQIKVQRKKVDAVNHYETEISRLNEEIDTTRSELCRAAGLHSPSSSMTQPSETVSVSEARLNNENKEHLSMEMDGNETSRNDQRSRNANKPDDSEEVEERKEGEEAEENKVTTTTAFVTFTSLRVKQAAIQCELTGNPDSMVVFPAADPNGILWNNIGVPFRKQNSMRFYAALFWMTGIMFWAVPVAFVTSIANFNSILKAFGVKPVNPSTGWYGLVSGLLPVVALMILMIVLYKAISAGATRFVRYKTCAEVDSYCLYWYMLFQFANLWLILIGGSLFIQINGILKNPTNLAGIIAKALPGASLFFVNMIIVSSFGAFGLELSMLKTYGVKLIMKLIKPEAARTQRQLDDGSKPPSLVWGQIVPPIIFIFLVVFLYMPIVPIVEIFGVVYFSGMYLVYKHQCLHVYAQEFEGGGEATWQSVFSFIMACLYTGEFVFIAYMGIKAAPVQGGMGFVPLIVTMLTHRVLIRKLIKPIRNLSLEHAADVDLSDGELSLESSNVDILLYQQPALDPNEDERGPMPYRRDVSETARNQDEGV